MTLGGKAAELAALRKRIETTLGKGAAWFYPGDPARGVAGYLGTGRAFFCGLAPSTGGVGKPDGPPGDAGSDAVGLLYDGLAGHGYADAHVTDIAKRMVKTGAADDLLKDAGGMERNRLWFAEEVAILDPDLLVAMDHRVEPFLRRWAPGRRVERVVHYSYAFDGYLAVRRWEAGWAKLDGGRR